MALLARQRSVWKGGPTFVLSFDVEYRADCESLLGLIARLDSAGIRSSFACIGTWVDRFAREHRAIVASGHEVMNHTNTHPWHDELGRPERFDRLGALEMRSEVAHASQKLRAIGATVLGFRAPHFGVQHTERVYPWLLADGLRFSSSTVASATARGGAPYLAHGIWEFPLTTCPRHPADLLDSWHCSTAPDARHSDPMDIAEIFSETLENIRRSGAFGSVYFDPRVVGDQSGYDAVIRLLADAAGDIRLATYGDLLGELERSRWAI